MAYRLIGQDATITIFDGGVFISTTPTWTSLGTTAFAKSIKIDDKVNTVDMRGIGDVRKKLRPTFAESTITLELLIQNTGPVVITEGGYGKVTFLPVAGGTLQTYQGIWTANTFDASMDNPQMQNLTLDCDYDNV